MRNDMHAVNTNADWLDLNQAERLYPVSRRTFWTWISKGRLPVYRPGKRKVLLKRSDIAELLESKRVNVDIDKLLSVSDTQNCFMKKTMKRSASIHP